MIGVFFLGVDRRLTLKISQVTVLAVLSTGESTTVINFVRASKILSRGQRLSLLSTSEQFVFEKVTHSFVILRVHVLLTVVFID